MAAKSFHRPDSVEAAVRALTAGGEDARALGGGATLVALLNAGLVEASALVSLAGIEELARSRREPDGSVRIGAMRRHRDTASDANLRDGQAVIAAAAAQIANVPVRNMGTIGGSVAFADPAADYPPALVAAQARIEIAGDGVRREVAAQDFFRGWYETALEANEIVTAIVVPPAPAGSRGIYRKLCRVAGDFAIASIALNLTRDANSVTWVRCAVGGCAGAPVRIEQAEALLSGGPLDAERLDAAGELIVAALDPVDDVRASAAYRRRVVPRLLRQALEAAGT